MRQTLDGGGRKGHERQSKPQETADVDSCRGTVKLFGTPL